MEKTVAERIAEVEARKEQGYWMPACGGTEVPFRTRKGYLLQYLYQPSTGRHAYINCETDLFLTTEEALLALGL